MEVGRQGESGRNAVSCSSGFEGGEAVFGTMKSRSVELVQAPRSGKGIGVFLGHPTLRVCRSAGRGADLLYTITFAERDAARAKDTHHSTAKEAARLASQAAVTACVVSTSARGTETLGSC